MTSSDTATVKDIIFSALDSFAILSVTNNRGRIIYASPAFAEITGYSVNQLIGENHRLLKSDQHNTEFFENLWQTISAGSSWRGIITNRHKNGSLFSLDTFIMPIMDERQRPQHYVAIRFIV